MNSHVKIWVEVYRCLDVLEIRSRLKHISLSKEVFQKDFQEESLNILLEFYTNI